MLTATTCRAASTVGTIVKRHTRLVSSLLDEPLYRLVLLIDATYKEQRTKRPGLYLFLLVGMSSIQARLQMLRYNPYMWLLDHGLMRAWNINDLERLAREWKPTYSRIRLLRIDLLARP